jgi:Flp pilus assembly protein TadG
MRALAPLSRIRRLPLAARFMRDRRAASAVEFALITPVVLLILVGEYTYCDVATTRRKVSITAHSLADLVARLPSISASQMTTILNASAQIVYPYDNSRTSIVLTEYSTDSSGKTTVTWSKALNGTALTAGASATLPSGMTTPSSSIICASVSYTYSPIFPEHLLNSNTLSNVFYENPRDSASVPYTN